MSCSSCNAAQVAPTAQRMNLNVCVASVEENPDNLCAVHISSNLVKHVMTAESQRKVPLRSFHLGVYRH